MMHKWRSGPITPRVGTLTAGPLLFLLLYTVLDVGTRDTRLQFLGRHPDGGTGRLWPTFPLQPVPSQRRSGPACNQVRRCLQLTASLIDGRMLACQRWPMALSCRARDRIEHSHTRRNGDPAAVMSDLGFGPLLLITSFAVTMSGSGASFQAGLPLFLPAIFTSTCIVSCFSRERRVVLILMWQRGQQSKFSVRDWFPVCPIANEAV